MVLSGKAMIPTWRNPMRWPWYLRANLPQKMMKMMLSKQHKFWWILGHIPEPAGIVKLQTKSFGPSNISSSNNKITRHKEMKQHTSLTTLLCQSKTTQRDSPQDYNKHLKNSWIIAHIRIWDVGNTKMKHRKNTSSYANTAKYAKHADKIMKITTKYYKKLLNSNHYHLSDYYVESFYHRHISWITCYSEHCMVHYDQKTMAGYHPLKPERFSDTCPCWNPKCSCKGYQQYPVHKYMHWVACFEDNCLTHNKPYFPKS